jgi:hypothetical protein
VLIVAYVLSFVDRQALSLLVEPIKHDLHLTDTQISLLQGFSFAIFLAFSDPMKLRYSLAALLPIMLLASAPCGFASLRAYRGSITRLQSVLTPAVAP